MLKVEITKIINDININNKVFNLLTNNCFLKTITSIIKNIQRATKEPLLKYRRIGRNSGININDAI